MQDVCAENVVVVDIETNGLNEKLHEILEIGCVITDPTMTRVLSQASALVYYEPGDLQRIYETSEDRVKKMHTENGLWDALRVTSQCYSLSTIGSHLAAWIRMWCGQDSKPVIMGNNVESFDRRFIREWLPELNNQLHYRSINVSSLREILRRHGVVLESEGKVPHRAVGDCLSTINLYHECMREIFRCESLRRLYANIVAQ